MFSDKNKNHPCSFAEKTIDYLYGELGDAERSKIESHLSGCASCSDELAALAVVRSSIADWKISRFDSLKTPLFVFPQEEKASIAKISFADSIRAYFSSSFRLSATASLAAAAILAASALFFYNQTGDQTVAGNFNDSRVAQSASPATRTDAEASSRQPVETANAPADDKDNETAESVVDNKIKTETVKKAAAAKKNIAPVAVRRSESAAKNSLPLKSPRENRENKVAARTVKKPSLGQSAEADEDDSLRLADIFNEISMR